MDRKTHVVVLTRHAEFHLVGRACRGVRERGTGAWIADHAAVGAELRGSRPLDGGELWPGALRAGTALVLQRRRPDDHAFVSDEVLAIEHPSRHESARVIEAAGHAIGVGADGETAPRSAGGRLLTLTAFGGLWGWLAPRDER